MTQFDSQGQACGHYRINEQYVQNNNYIFEIKKIQSEKKRNKQTAQHQLNERKKKIPELLYIFELNWLEMNRNKKKKEEQKATIPFAHVVV